jgi:hypothetical protein
MRDGVSHLCHTESFRGIAASIVRPIATASEAQSLQRLAAARRMARPAGLEPATPGLEGEIHMTQVMVLQYFTQGAMPRCHAEAVTKQPSSRNMLLHVLGQHLVDQRLVAYLPPPRLFADTIQDVWIQANRDETTCRVTEQRATDPTHRAQLLVRRLRNVREVNPPRPSRTRLFPCGSPASR